MQNLKVDIAVGTPNLGTLSLDAPICQVLDIMKPQSVAGHPLIIEGSGIIEAGPGPGLLKREKIVLTSIQ